MIRPALLLAAAALVTLTGCNRHKDDGGSSVSISTSDDGKTTTTSTSSENGDSSATASSVELKLPGGFEANVKGPHNFNDSTHVDIDGVGLYPGAKVSNVQVKVDASGDSDKHATVNMAFAAKSDPAAVADWYQQQFEAKKLAVTRAGNTLTGKSKDGDDFVIAALPNKDGGTAGTIAIVGK